MARIQMQQSAPQEYQPRSNGYGDRPKRDFQPIPEDEIVQVEVVEVKLEEKPAKWQKPGDTHRVSWHFKVTEGPFANRHLWGNTPTWLNNSPKCVLRQWIQEVLGLDVLPDDFVFDTDEFAGLSARVLVGQRTKQDGTPTDFAKDVLRSWAHAKGNDISVDF